ncbi:hypothetical protein [Salimicrobium jeotgali]|nr:hypothetical protein [Salimicrobium jeotgali]
MLNQFLDAFLLFTYDSLQFLYIAMKALYVATCFDDRWWPCSASASVITSLSV